MAHRFDVFKPDGTPVCSQCGKTAEFLSDPLRFVDGLPPRCLFAPLAAPVGRYIKHLISFAYPLLIFSSCVPFLWHLAMTPASPYLIDMYPPNVIHEIFAVSHTLYYNYLHVSSFSDVSPWHRTLVLPDLNALWLLLPPCHCYNSNWLHILTFCLIPSCNSSLTRIANTPDYSRLFFIHAHAVSISSIAS